LLINRGLAAISRAENLLATNASSLQSIPTIGPYLLQAKLAACHARARTPEETDWPRIVSLYTELAQILPSPVIELNRAVAVSMAQGPQAALELVEVLATDPSLVHYHLLPSVQADLLFRLGRHAEARPFFERAAALTQNTRERALLLARAASCDTQAQ
jgi:predicted RNA polymerase sigma factor